MARSRTSFDGSKPGPGQPKMTPEEKIRRRAMKKATKELAFNFKDELSKILPTITRNVARIAAKGNRAEDTTHLRLLDSVGDRIFGKPPQAITGSNGGPLLVSFTQLVDKVDGNKQEKF